LNAIYSGAAGARITWAGSVFDSLFRTKMAFQATKRVKKPLAQIPDKRNLSFPLL
jgi:hypothetical protein